MKASHGKDADCIQRNTSMRIVVICFILCLCNIFYTV